MNFVVSSSKLTGNPGKSGWSQVHDFKPADKEKLQNRGHLFAVIATKKNQEGVEGVAVGRELLTRLHEEYFGSSGTSAFNALSASCEKVINEFKDSLGVVEISTAVSLEDVVYTACGGGGGISIVRNEMLAAVLESSYGEAKVVSASGYPKNDDILILASSSFFTLFSDGQIRAAFTGKDLSAAVEKLAPAVHSGSNTGSVGAVFLRFNMQLPLVGKDQETREIRVSEEERPKRMIINKPSPVLSFAQKVKGRVVEGIKRATNRKIYVSKSKDDLKASKERKVYISAGIILLVLLLVSMFFGVRRKNEQESKARYQDRLVSAQHQFDESVSLFELDANRARELFSESASTVNALIAEGIEDPQLSELSEKLKEQRGRILGEYEREAELFVELSLVSEGFLGNDLIGSNENVFILNEGGEMIISVSYSTKGSEVVAGPEQIEGAKKIAVYSDRLFYLSNDGVYEVSEEVRVIDGQWEGAVLIQAYAGNIYVLDKAVDVIWRYAGFEGGFSSGNNWFSESVTPDLSEVVSWSIDGSIWTLDSLGKISKFTFGIPQDFSLSSVSPLLIRPTSIFTSEDLEFIYLLDPDNSRVVVIDKEGNYQAQYKAEEAKNATDLAVSEKERKIVLLSGDRLYSVEIKHLE